LWALVPEQLRLQLRLSLLCCPPEKWESINKYNINKYKNSHLNDAEQTPALATAVLFAHLALALLETTTTSIDQHLREVTRRD
jgi:hypothetical protein